MNARMITEAEEQAIAWVVRTRDPAFTDWDAFTAWLEAAPDHARLYDEMMSADDQIAVHLAGIPAPERVPAPRRWPLVGGVIAAALALFAVALPMLTRPAFTPQTIASLPGQRLSVRLVDGSRIDLNGDTRLVLDGPRHARLDHGEALFTIVHDDARPFEVTSGAAVVRDVGTTFNLVRTPQTFTATVSEGEVVFNPDRENVSVPAGRELREEANRVTVSHADPAQVGGWRQGRLIYRGATLRRISQDLSRGLGIAVTADAAVSQQPFSGIIQLEGAGEKGLRSAAATLGLRVRRSGDGWILAAP